MNENSRKKVTVCIPVYNGALTIGSLVSEVMDSLQDRYETEIVLVNDYSRDNSHDVCRDIATKNSAVKYIRLRKNFGEHNAVMCALNYSTGDLVAIIDDDFQNPPSEILKLLDEAEQGFDVVYSKFKIKRHNLYRNLGSKFNDLVATWLLDKPKGLYLSSFKVISAEMVKQIIRYTGPAPYVDGLLLRETRNYSVVEVEHHEREAGQSNYTLAKLVSLWLNMFINFSVKPLRLFALFGISVTIVSFVAAAVFIIQKMIDPSLPMGWTSVMVSILFFSGVQIIFLGLIGEYIGKNYLQINGTPQWSVEEEHL